MSGDSAQLVILVVLPGVTSFLPVAAVSCQTIEIPAGITSDSPERECVKLTQNA